jgi:AcrR family transcriptional regulator
MSAIDKPLGNQTHIKEGPGEGALKSQKPTKTRHRSRDKTLEELQFAMLRVKNKGKKLTISAVAKEAGVTPGLIHNTYPDIAEAIRAQVGKGTRQQRDDKMAELSKARERIKELRSELDAALHDIQRLASINETLRQEVAMLRSAGSGKVVTLSPRRH